MKVVICPDSFKESLSAKEVCDCVERGLKEASPRVRIWKMPLADGGEGTVEALVTGAGGMYLRSQVTGPLGTKVWAKWGVLKDGKTAVIEMAQASGLALVPKEKRNPLITTTYGTGELIRKALNKGCKRIIVGIGGSATVDGGIGMAQALGVRIMDSKGREVGLGGGELERIEKIDIRSIDNRIARTEFIVASDVRNPLLGPTGAASTYAPQKGATPEIVKRLESGLANLARVIKKDLDTSVANVPGGGAAGGLGAGLYAFLGARIESGIDLVMNTVKLEDRMRHADLVITGEGKIDRQTFYGKAVIGVIRIARRYGVPVICIAGSIMPEAKVLYKMGVKGLFSITPMPMTLQEAIQKARPLLVESARSLGYLLTLVMK